MNLRSAGTLLQNYPWIEKGVAYQTLVASILHKYVSGSLYDVTANKGSAN